MLKDLPRYECLLEAAARYPSLEPRANEAFLNLLWTADLVFAGKGHFLAQHNISQGRFTVMMLLNRCCEGPCTPASLADEAGVTRATMTGLVDTLEKDGLVVRDSDPADRRAIHVRLTPHGQTLLETILPEWFLCVSEMMRPLSDDERQQLVHLLQKIQQGLTPAGGVQSLNPEPVNPSTES